MGFNARVLENYNAHPIKLPTYTYCIRYFVVLNWILLHDHHELHKKDIIYPYPSNLSGSLPHLLQPAIQYVGSKREADAEPAIQYVGSKREAAAEPAIQYVGSKREAEAEPAIQYVGSKRAIQYVGSKWRVSSSYALGFYGIWDGDEKVGKLLLEEFAWSFILFFSNKPIQ